MNKKRLLLAFVILFIVLLPPVVLAEGNPGTDSSGIVTSEEVFNELPNRSVSIRKSLTRTKMPKATVVFWNKVAQCETASNWKDGGRWGGGLGIYVGTWENFGGEEFAPHPSKATKEEQIIVANRISTQGYKTVRHRDPEWAKRKGVPVSYAWEKEPVGFGGWGCYKSKSTGKYRMAKPKLYYYDKPSMVPLASFHYNERGAIVKDLQTFLRIPVDGHYGARTRRAHMKWLIKNGHPLDGVPDLPPKKK